MLAGTPTGTAIYAAIKRSGNTCFVANAGASEKSAEGTLPEEYEAFDGLLQQAKLAHLSRLNPPIIWGVTFEAWSGWPAKEAWDLVSSIQAALFPDPMQMFLGCSDDLHSKNGLRHLNRLCDVLTMWCHIYYGNHVFCTSDKNFHKPSHRAALLKLGAKQICTPEQLIV